MENNFSKGLWNAGKYFDTYSQGGLVTLAHRALDAITVRLLVLVVICVVLGLGHFKLLQRQHEFPINQVVHPKGK